MLEPIDKFIYFWLVTLHNAFSALPFHGRRWQPTLAVRIFFIIIALIAGIWLLSRGNKSTEGWVFLGSAIFAIFIEWRMWSYIGEDYINHINR